MTGKATMTHTVICSTLETQSSEIFLAASYFVLPAATAKIINTGMDIANEI